MRGSPGRATLAAAVFAVALACAPAALAADRYASPYGDASAAATCPRLDECDIQTAVEDPSVNPGDRIIVFPGVYTLTDPIDTPVGVTIESDEGVGRPILRSNGAVAMIVDTPSVIRNLRIETQDNTTGRALDMTAPSVGERLEVVATGTTGTAVQLRNGALLRDSVAWNRDAAGGIAVTTGGTGADLRNVTAIAAQAGGVALFSSASFGSTQLVTLRNVIGRAPATGVGIQAEDNADATEPDDVEVTVTSSNYSTFTDDEPESDVVLNGTANQTASPAFADAATGNFHQSSNSVTIDAGTVDALLGTLDLDGDARILGSAPDIGADELAPTQSQPPPQVDTFPPDTGIRKGPKRKTPKRKTKFEFGGSEPGVTFECRLDVGSRQGTFESCTSPHKVQGLKRSTKYVFTVRAVDAAGNADPTPADRRWKVTKKKRGK